MDTGWSAFRTGSKYERLVTDDFRKAPGLLTAVQNGNSVLFWDSCPNTDLGAGEMCDRLMDGPPEIEIKGGFLKMRAYSDGVRETWTFRMEDALIGESRFQNAKEAWAAQQPCEVLEFPAVPGRRHADTA